MTDNIMFYPAIVLMIVEAGALAFLAVNGRLHITRPPQSWCYVEEL